METPFRPVISKKYRCVECTFKTQVIIPWTVDMEKIIAFLESTPFKCDECYVKEKRRSRM
jgi:hypothetical protein